MVERICEENLQSNSKPKTMEDTLASILKDLELAEMSLRSTSHLVEPTDNEITVPATDTLITNFNSISKEIKDTKVEESASTFHETNDNDCDLMLSEQPNHLPPCPELKEESFKSSANFEESKLLLEEFLTKTSTNSNIGIIKENYPTDQHLTEMDPQNISNKSTDNKLELKIPLPSSNPYINFLQDFQAKYSGDEVTTSMLAALASAQWRKMGKEEKQKYKNIKKSHCEKDKRVQKLRKYIKSINISEEAIFENSLY